MPQQLARRSVEIAVKLATDTQTNQPNTFSEGGGDTVTLRGSRTSVRIKNSGSPGGSTASVDVWGLTPSLMNQLATLGIVFNLVARNTLTISAGIEGQGLAVVFGGTITAGYADYDSSPDVPFHFECNSGLADAVAPANATSYTGSTDVATIMGGFARLMNLGFENNGVSSQLSNPYFAGNVFTQMRACAEHANINAEIVNGNVLAIWPKGGSRNTANPPLIAAPPDGQMIGYPAYTQNGIIVRTVFDPRISFGGLVEVRSTLTDAAAQSKSADAKLLIPANGQWSVYQLDHALDSQMPRGHWMSTINAFNPRYPRPIAPGPRG